MTLDRAAIASLTALLDQATARHTCDHEQIAVLAVEHLQALGWRPPAVVHHHVPPGAPARRDPQPGGSTCGVIGFGARDPWDGPPAWTGHNGPQA